MTRKFKIGDIVEYDHGDDIRKDPRIVGYWTDKMYVVESLTEDTRGLLWDDFRYTMATELIPFEGTAWIMPENQMRLAYTDVIATKLARKIHNEAEDLGNGYLRIKNERL
jgi:hypothetical protein